MPEPAVYRSLKLSIVDGLLHAVMVGVSESYLGAFAVELGHGASDLALLTTVPLFAGSLAQLLGPALTLRLGSRGRFVACGAALQGISLLAFYAIAQCEERRLGPLLLAKILFWVAGLIITPAWSAWMAHLTERIRRDRYFALRSAASQTVLMVSFAGAGAALERAASAKALLNTYSVLFLVAVSARLGSALALALQSDPKSDHDRKLLPVRERFGLALRTSEWRVALYLAALMLGGQIAIPFFTPFMLRELGLDYGQFTALSTLSLLAKALFFPVCHRLSLRFGLKPLVVASGVGIALLPTIWAFADTLPPLVAAQLLSGVVWAGMDYASFQLLLTSSRKECRFEFLSLANSLSGGLQVAGSLLGAQITQGLGYREVFLWSALARGLALILLVASIRRLRLPSELPRLFMRLLGVRPSGGALRRPIITDAPPPDSEDR